MLSIKKNKIFSALYLLFTHIPIGRRFQIFLVFLLIIISSFAEIVSIGSIIPFISFILNPTTISDSIFFNRFIKEINFTDLSLFFTILFISAAFFSAFFRVLLVKLSTKYSFLIGCDLSLKMFRLSLYQPYDTHLERNSSELISGIVHKTYSLITVIMMSLNLFASIIISTVIIATLIFLNPLASFLILISLGVIYFSVMMYFRKKLLLNSLHESFEVTKVIKILQEGLGGVRDILLNGTQDYYCQLYNKSDISLRLAQAENQFISSSPRYIIESLGLTIIALLAFWFCRNNDNRLTDVIPILAAVAISIQRLLPLIQQIYSSWSTILANKSLLEDGINLLEQKIPILHNFENIDFQFKESITLKNISYAYTNSPNKIILDNVNITIKKGMHIGIVGNTGSGKTTFTDLLMGLLTPTVGSIYIDDLILNQESMRSWQKKIAHVPQSIFLTDASIKENIAFSISPDEIDFKNVVEAAREAHIHTMIDNLPEKYNTQVGERGIRFSGGQRQRIGIARALYKNAEVLFFDEATSALDNETEVAVMEAINQLDKNLTVFIVAHRLTTLKSCDLILEIDNGKINNLGNYENYINNKNG